MEEPGAPGLPNPGMDTNWLGSLDDLMLGGSLDQAGLSGDSPRGSDLGLGLAWPGACWACTGSHVQCVLS